MRNLVRKGLDARLDHLWCEYCGDAGKYRRDNIQYLHHIEEIVLDIKKTATTLAKFNGLF